MQKNFLNICGELKISKLDISKKKLNIDGHLVSALGGCGGLERIDFLTVSTSGGCGGFERTDF